MDNTQNSAAKCPYCGGSEFERGWVHAPLSRTNLLYSQIDEGGLLGLSGSKVTSWRCLGCNRLEFFAGEKR